MTLGNISIQKAFGGVIQVKDSKANIITEVHELVDGNEYEITIDTNVLQMDGTGIIRINIHDLEDGFAACNFNIDYSKEMLNDIRDRKNIIVKAIVHIKDRNYSFKQI